MILMAKLLTIKVIIIIILNCLIDPDLDLDGGDLDFED